MRVTVLGATGRTGRRLVAQALEEGHDVTAVARRPEQLQLQHPNLVVLRGDVLEPATLDAPITSADVVLSCVGVESRGPTTLSSRGVTNIIAAMRQHAKRRLILVSSASTIEGPHGMPAPVKWVARQFYGGSYDDAKRMEAIIERSGLDWTMVRPTRLTNRREKGRYRLAVGRIPPPRPPGPRVSRSDVARFMLRQLDSDTYLRQAPTISN